MQYVRLRASDFSAQTKIDAFQDAISAICKLEFKPDHLESFQSETSIAVLPGLITGYGRHSTCSVARTTKLAEETGDNIMVHMPISGGFTMQQKNGPLVECSSDVVYIDPNEVSGKVRFHAAVSDVFYVSIPRGLVDCAGEGAKTKLRSGQNFTPLWRMFRRYAYSLHQEAQELSPAELSTCVSHVQDLALMALGAGGDAAVLARERSLPAARLREIKRDIERNLANPDLSPHFISVRHHISERYLRLLFEREDTSFRDFVSRRRLLAAHRMLLDPTRTMLGISDIALACGFGDLSWFNARFKQCFGLTPRQVRMTMLDRLRQEGAPSLTSDCR